MSILDFFPAELPIRKEQREALLEVEKAILAGKKYIVVDAPVGSGKSAIAITIARWRKCETHMITPQKVLQDQYEKDFDNRVVTMKGASNYPCDYANRHFGFNSRNVCGSTAPCKTFSAKIAKDIRSRCLGKDGYVATGCSYIDQITLANSSPVIVHNFHSFLYQTMGEFARFTSRPLMIIDEGHMIEPTLQQFGTFNIRVPKAAYLAYGHMVAQETEDMDFRVWHSRFSEFIDEYSERNDNPSRPGDNKRSRWIEHISKLELVAGYSNGYICEFEEIEPSKQREGFPDEIYFKAVSKSIAPIFRNRIMNLCSDVMILMSGTWYGFKETLASLGIPSELAAHVQVDSTFPVKNRPYIWDPALAVTTNYAGLKDVRNVSRLMSTIQSILDKHPDEKGLIHTNSYDLNTLIVSGLSGHSRVVTHAPDTTHHTLMSFYDSEEPLVLASPSCNQGVDFKYDRARFQIIVRLPRLPIGDKYVAYKMKSDANWYNRQTAITFGQQLGRVVRAEDDWGITYIIDDMFPDFYNKYLRRNAPNWLLRGYVYGLPE